MRVLLDTNIMIHREASRVVNDEIGVLFNWFDRLHYEKCIHPLSVAELEKHGDSNVVQTFQAKIKNYTLLKTEAPKLDEIVRIREKYDKDDNDSIDTSLLKEVFSNRVGLLLTEDRKMHTKAIELGISDHVFTIDAFLEKVTAENPTLFDYKVLSVRKEFFGNININDVFFDSFKEDYQDFGDWFNKKADEVAYVCQSETGNILAFLYIKKEEPSENYSDIKPILKPKNRLKIGTFKVVSNGFKLGERFLKIIFDNALSYDVDEIYVTLFHEREEHDRLIWLLEDWGFKYHGIKTTPTGNEEVYIKDYRANPNVSNPKLTYPFISKNRRYFITPIWPDYHTELLPDSILNNESPNDFIENEPHRNAIQKVYISRSIYRDLEPGDIIVFYRTGGYYKGVLSTIGIVESVITNIKHEDEFVRLCRKRSVFDDKELINWWNYKPRMRPFVVNFLCLYSLPKRPNLKTLLDNGIVRDINSVPRGFEELSKQQFDTILKVSEANESFIVN